MKTDTTTDIKQRQREFYAYARSLGCDPHEANQLKKLTTTAAIDVRVETRHRHEAWAFSADGEEQ